MKLPLSYPFSICPEFGAIHFVDLYQCAIINNKLLTVDEITFKFFSVKLPFVDSLVYIRNFIVKIWGLRTDFEDTQKPLFVQKYDVGDQLVYFTIVSRTENVIVLEENDKHLLFRIYCSVIKENDRKNIFSISTVVHFHNRWGRLYFFFVKPFHKWIVSSTIKKLYDNYTSPFICA